MRETIIEYIKRTKDETLKTSPFNEVDSLILSQLSYLKFDSIVPGPGGRENAISLKEIAAHPEYDSLYADERYRKENSNFFEKLLDSERFGNIRLHSYVNYINVDEETQFSAVVVEFDDLLTYVVFRGTDENLISWKEDLNLALLKPIPAQLRSVDYLNEVSGYIQNNFYIGGHSKGGNLAIYAALNCKEDVFQRINAIYNHDGPGIRPELIDQDRYRQIKYRIKMTVPEASLVGMLMLITDNYRVVESKRLGLSQHDPYGWLINGYEFKTADSIKEVPAIRGKSINEWIMAMDENEISMFISTISEIIAASGAKTLNDMSDNWTSIAKNIAQAIKDVDDETKEFMGMLLDMLKTQVGENVKARFDDMVGELKQQVSDMAENAKTNSAMLGAKINEILPKKKSDESEEDEDE